MTHPSRGTLFLVVGPSGAGKDTLLDCARQALAGNPAYIFARRVITRPADAGGEAHEALSGEAFEALESAKGLALSWAAHGLSYGIRRDIEAQLAAGINVVANVSRQVLDEARRRFPPVKILEVTATREVLAARLAARGRETAADIARRLERAGAVEVSGPDVIRVDNSRDLASGIAAFVEALKTT